MLSVGRRNKKVDTTIKYANSFIQIIFFHVFHPGIRIMTLSFNEIFTLTHICSFNVIFFPSIFVNSNSPPPNMNANAIHHFVFFCLMECGVISISQKWKVAFSFSPMQDKRGNHHFFPHILVDGVWPACTHVWREDGKKRFGIVNWKLVRPEGKMWWL